MPRLSDGSDESRGIDLTLSQLIEDAATRADALPFAVVDIDSSKPLNDNYGHQIGDEPAHAGAHPVGLGEAK